MITVAGMPGEIDITNVRAPSLRDLVKPDGTLNGPFMHDGSFATLLDVVNHYNHIPNHPENTNLDIRLKDSNGNPQQLNLTESEKQDLVAFLKTLGGSDIYTNEKWSNPFEPDGSITIIDEVLALSEENALPSISIYPNPATNTISIGGYDQPILELRIRDLQGKLLKEFKTLPSNPFDVSDLSSGVYFLHIRSTEGAIVKRFIKM